MTDYVKSPLCFIYSFPDKFVINTIDNSYCIRTHHSHNVIREILAKIEKPFSVTQLTSGLSEADNYTAQQFIAFLEQKGIIVSSDTAQQINQANDDLVSFYITNSTKHVGQKRVSILCSSQLIEILHQYQPLFQSIVITTHEIECNGIDAKKINFILEDSPDILAIATIGEDRSLLTTINQQCHWANQPWISATTFQSMATYGPICTPGVTPCWNCAQQRLDAKHLPTGLTRDDVSHLPISYPRSMLHSFVSILLHHIAMYAISPSSAPLNGWIQKLDLLTFDSARYRAFYFPGCPICDDT